MLLLEDGKTAGRRLAVGGPLAPLFESLVGELRPLLDRGFRIPTAKALLSRAGGRCERDGSVLDFDPWSPDAHLCPTCGAIHTGELHHRAWVTFYQLWLAERALHAALFNVLRPDPSHATLARAILHELADAYLLYPNRDNVLGPTRLFFSTYLESIWLLQICVAADALAQHGDHSTLDRVRDRIVEPSRALIAEYDEGLSNRQVWNNAALLAAAALCGDAAAFDERVNGASGLTTHLRQALLPDGTWYEGENYHQFALRGLWYGVALCEAKARRVEPTLIDRFERAFAAPFLTALPDFTMPSRKDSQYAVSLRQWRLAELAELGFARSGDPVLGMALARSYEAGHESRDTGRARSAADVERNAPSGALTRADLGWRALLHALPELPALPVGAARSAHLEAQGLAVFRRTEDVYVALDYGQSGGGHGHPDRLNLTLAQGETRWLDDLGTGSYVDPTLHWFRSTLAHNAPMIDGVSQPLREGSLVAHDEREGMGWIEASFAFAPSNLARRVDVIAPDYLLDEVTFSLDRPARVELPWHLDARLDGIDLRPTTLEGGAVADDGFGFVTGCLAAPIGADRPIDLMAERDGRALRMTLTCDHDFTLFSLQAPGQPPATSRRFLLARAEGESRGKTTVVFRAFLAWSGDVSAVHFEPGRATVAYRDGERHTHQRVADGWRVDLFAGGAKSSIDLGGVRAPPVIALPQVPPPAAPMVLRRTASLPTWLSDSERSDAHLALFDLGSAHYRRSEESWSQAGSPRATIALGAGARHLVVFAVIAAGERRFAAAGADNAFDNEAADTMTAGVQLYLRTPEASGAWMLVPEPDGEHVRVRVIPGWGAMDHPAARWRERVDGAYELRIDMVLPEAASQGEYPIDVDVIVNETVSARERRRGQLVLSGGRGEFVYLRGDRHEPERLLPFVIAP
jgi:hypothetical protein